MYNWNRSFASLKRYSTVKILSPIFIMMIALLSACGGGDGSKNTDGPDPTSTLTCDIQTPQNRSVFYIGDSISFRGTSNDSAGEAITYRWDFGDGTTASGDAATHQYTNEGAYDVVLTASKSPTEIASASVSLVVEKHTCTIERPANNSVRDLDEIISFNGAADQSDRQVTSFSWDFGDGTTATGQEVVHQFASEGIYTVELTTTYEENSKATDSIALTIEQLFTVSGLVFNKGSGVQGVSVTLAGDSEYKAETDINGEFSFSLIPKGEYLLSMANEKYNPSPEAYRLHITDKDIAGISFDAIDFEMLYDVAFGSPQNTVSLPPATGSETYPRNTPSEIVFGQPRVVSEYYDLDDQPCEFGGYEMKYPGYDQISFYVEKNYDILDRFSVYRIEMDIVVGAIEGITQYEEFTILLDTPSVRRIDFKADGTVAAYGSGNSSFAQYEFEKIVKVKIIVDKKNKQITYDVNNQTYTQADIVPMLRTIRLNMHSASVNSTVAVDNIRIFDITNRSNFEYFVFDGDQFETLAFPGAESTTCSGFNDHGDVVGHYWLNGAKSHFLRDSGGYHQIDLADQLNPELVDINNQKVMVGGYDTNSPYGFVLDEMQQLDSIFFGTQTFVGGINDSGVVVAGNQGNRLYIGDQSNYYDTTLGLSTPYNSAGRINNANLVVGNHIGFLGYLDDEDGWGFESYIYDGSDFTTVAYPGAFITYFSGINDNNTISGYYLNETSNSTMFTYEQGAFSIIAHPEGHDLFSVDINNSGQILGGMIRSPHILNFEN